MTASAALMRFMAEMGVGPFRPAPRVYAPVKRVWRPDIIMIDYIGLIR
jgi:hypothetical protein